MRPSLRFIALAACAFALAAAGCAPASRPSASGAAAGGDAIVVPASTREIAARATAPGAPATVLNVWATWCPPCRAEFPALLAAVRRHPGVRLVLVSADFDTATAQVRAFLRGHGVTDTTYLKREGDQAFVDGLEPAWSGTLPATIVYDAAGRKVAFWEGAADSAKFEDNIQKALHASPTTEGTR